MKTMGMTLRNRVRNESTTKYVTSLALALLMGCATVPNNTPREKVMTQISVEVADNSGAVIGSDATVRTLQSEADKKLKALNMPPGCRLTLAQRQYLNAKPSDGDRIYKVKDVYNVICPQDK